jgi:hypothetical protein
MDCGFEVPRTGDFQSRNISLVMFAGGVLLVMRHYHTVSRGAYGSPCIFRSRNMTTATAAASKTMAAPDKNVIPTALV